MAKENLFQIQFLNKIKNELPETVSLSDELGDLLQISTDSVYRRIRGETLLDINEIQILCNRFQISFDSVINNPGSTSFNYEGMGSSKGFENYLKTILNDMLLIESANTKQIIYTAIDVPIFHHFNYPELSAFKMFYWMKAVVNDQSLSDKKFSPQLVSEELAELGKKIYEVYCKIPSVEIWTDETINSLIKQIEFYWDSGNFASPEDALIVCEKAKAEIETLQIQAEKSSKTTGISGTESNFTLFHSDIEIGNNCIYTKRDGFESIYLSVHTFNKIKTSDFLFVNDTKLWLENLIKKSNQISGVSQIFRYKFFKKASDKLEKLVEKITENKH
jgi:hypothetical protein